MNAEKYHQSVADYYDEEAESFESRANDNHVLMTLRNVFRQKVLEGDVQNLLEIGYGPGLDMVWFAEAQKRLNPSMGLTLLLSFTRLFHKKQNNCQR